MRTDPKNALTYTASLASKSQATNNTGGTAIDSSLYVGSIAFVVNIGVKTAGDNDGAVTVVIQSSADNAATNATNVASVANIATTNNTAAIGVILVDPAATLRYILPRVIIAGTNSPAYPVGVVAVGTKRVQP